MVPQFRLGPDIPNEKKSKILVNDILLMKFSILYAFCLSFSQKKVFPLVYQTATGFLGNTHYFK